MVDDMETLLSPTPMLELNPPAGEVNVMSGGVPSM